MSEELEGQMALFNLDGCSPEEQDEYADEVCDGPACWCAPRTNADEPDDPADS